MKRHIHLVIIWGLVLMAALTGCRGGGANKGGGNGEGSTDPTSFAYVANSYANSISAYAINTADGGLTPITGSPFSTGDTSPRSLATDPDGKFLYALNSSKEVLVYSLDPASGSIDLIPESPFTTDNIPEKVVVDPTGDFVAVGCRYFLNISPRDPASGALSDRQSFIFAEGEELKAVSFGPTGQYLYVAVSSGSTGGIYVYAKNPDRTFTQITGSPFTTCPSPSSLAFGPNHQFLYVTSSGSTAMAFHSMESDGSLGTVTNYNLMGQTAVSLILGNFIFTNPAFKNLESLAIGDDGKLTLTGSKVTLSSNISSLAVDPTGKYLYATGWYTNDIWIISINTADGSLTQLSADPFDNGAEIRAIITVQPGN